MISMFAWAPVVAWDAMGDADEIDGLGMTSLRNMVMSSGFSVEYSIGLCPAIHLDRTS